MKFIVRIVTGWVFVAIFTVGLYAGDDVVISTLAGSVGSSGSADGSGSAARFNLPTGIAVDNSGNVYIADESNYTIRKITPAGLVTTVAGLAGSRGYVDGTGSAVRFYDPVDIAVDSSGNMYVTEYGPNTVRKITPGGVVTTFAGTNGSSGSTDGTGSAARFNNPFGIAIDNAGNLYVAEAGNNTVRKITSGGVVTTLAGSAGSAGSTDGTGSAARFNTPTGIAVDNSGNVYVADGHNHTIRKITSAGVVTTLAGSAGSSGSADGTGAAARFHYPSNLSVDNAGNVYVADSWNHTIRKITSDGVVTTLAGSAGSIGSTDGSGTTARFQYPADCVVDNAGNIYVLDEYNYTVRKMTSSALVTTLAGLAGSRGYVDGTGSAVRFYDPVDIAVDSSGNMYVTEYGSHIVRKITLGGVVTTFAGSSGNSGSTDGTGSAARFNNPFGITIDNAGILYVVEAGNNTVRKITSGGVVTTLAGSAGSAGSTDGTGSAARFNTPTGIAVDNSGNVYVADGHNHTIRKITSAGVVTTLAGSAGSAGSTDGTGSAARFYYPSNLSVDNAGNVYVADSWNHTIRKVTSGGVVTTLAGLAGSSGHTDGSGTAARFQYPADCVVDNAGNIYVLDEYNYTVRKITSGALVTTVAGYAGSVGSDDGPANSARFNLPTGIAIDSNGNLYLADESNYTIRKIIFGGYLTPSAPTGISASVGTYTDKIRLTWISVSNAASYQVWRNTSDSSASSAQIGTTAGTTYDDTDATISVTYYYWVKATNTSGASAFSAAASGYRASASDLLPPSGVQATDGAYTSKVRITWSAVSNATSYEVWRSTGDDVNTAAKIAETSVTTTTYDDTSVVLGAIYYYWLKAKNASSTSGFSSSDAGYLVSSAAYLDAPLGVLASDGTYTNKVATSWTVVSGASNYEIWRGQTNSAALATLLTIVTTNVYEDTAVTAGVTYYYWVRAKNLVATSAYSLSDVGYCGVGSGSGTADLAATSMLFEPAVIESNAHPTLVMALLVNNGPDAMTDETVSFDFYLSRNMVFGDADDQWIGDYRGTASITAGGYTTVIVADTGLAGITIPDTASGLYYVFSYVRHAATLVDPDLSNNTAMRSGALVVGGTAEGGAKRPVKGDFDGDGKIDLAPHQEATGNLQVKLSGFGYGLVSLPGFGGLGYTSMASDFDGDGKADPIVYQESTGNWFIRPSNSGYALETVNMGGLGYKAVQGDFNGGNQWDLAVYREATGYWLILLAETQALSVYQFGQADYLPVTGDFDGDRKTDFGLHRETGGRWQVKLSGSGYAEVALNGFGGNGYEVVGGDFDGDGKEDLALYKKEGGQWHVRLSGSNYQPLSLTGFGGEEYEALSGDYDGDGLADLVIYNAATSTWLLLLSSAGYAQVSITF